MSERIGLKMLGFSATGLGLIPALRQQQVWDEDPWEDIIEPLCEVGVCALSPASPSPNPHPLVFCACSTVSRC